MRCTQNFGISEEARQFLLDNGKKIPSETCPTCGHTTGGGLNVVVYDRETGVGLGMFEDGPVLCEYEMKDGRFVQEVVQSSDWSSGPCIFLCLRWKDTGEKFCLWPDEEIRNA